jgi:hypothetical protein
MPAGRHRWPHCDTFRDYHKDRPASAESETVCPGRVGAMSIIVTHALTTSAKLGPYEIESPLAAHLKKQLCLLSVNRQGD